MEVGRRDGNRRTLSQINVTPFVDVMLVLLIIFMVTAPMMEQGLDVNLPEVENAPGLSAGNEPLVVTVARNGNISVGHSRVDTPQKLTPVLKQILAGNQQRQVLLEADRDVPYGRVVQVMAAIRGAGVEKLGMVSEQPQD
ncbi:protein TolR [Desulfuromonas carbonis]|uniref:protein TolR n=1 Tax=Desulfuromonas sp. DDH964 TaxID=1823759 RepID=UPI00078CC6D8|nr:protein TolR [Desulfuromonas sp. DDH964]AMV70419.1 biopolymer transport membrane TolR-like protein [Desulfuromonas sp. DDH964]